MIAFVSLNFARAILDLIRTILSTNQMQTKNNRDPAIRVFPRFKQLASFHLELSLLMIMWTFVPIGHFDYFGSGFTTPN